MNEPAHSRTLSFLGRPLKVMLNLQLNIVRLILDSGTKTLNNEKAMKFRSFLVQRFEDTVSGILGEGVKEALLDRMERNTGLKRGELIVQIDILKGFLKGTFGKTALVLEGMVAKQIYSELGSDAPPQDLKVAIEHAKHAYMSSAPNLLVSR